MNYKDIIIRPIITEKTMRYMDENNVVTFEVKKGSNKILIKQAVENIFHVDVDKVNVVNVRPKTKRVGRYIGKTKAVRKAYVKSRQDRISICSAKRKQNKSGRSTLFPE